MMGTEASSPIRIAIVEDREDLRTTLAERLEQVDDFRVAGAFASMEEAIPEISRDPPSVTLVDIGLPGMSGIEGIRILKKSRPDLLMIVLSIFDDDERIFDAICAGACGYVLKKMPMDRLVGMIRDAVDGGAPMSPEVARRVLELFRHYSPPEAAPHRLTPHELRVLKMLVDGSSYKAAAADLKVSIHTVAFHVRRIYEKLQVHSKSEAVSKALRDGILR